MRRIFLLLFFLSAYPATAQVYVFSYFVDNGQDGLHYAVSRDGLNWKALRNGASFLTPAVGKDKLMRDPCIVKGPDGTFHMVWTSGWWDKIIGYASSKDLVNWSEQTAIPVMEQEPAAKNSWAPEVFYDKASKKFLIYWATTIPGRHKDVADSEREKGLNHRIYYTSTKDFKVFTPTALFFNPDFSVIDATILHRGKDYFLFLKNENPKPAEKNIRITKAPKAEGPYPTQVSPPITGNYWAEGPTAAVVGDYVYVYFDKYTEHRYGAVRSTDMEHWEDVSDQVHFPKGIRHGTVIQLTEKEYAALKAYEN